MSDPVNDALDGEDAAAVNDGAAADLHIPIARERVVLRKQTSERVAANIRLRTSTDDVVLDEPLQSERVEIERVPVDVIVATPPETRVEDGVTIIPVVEEVLVRQFRIVEEVRIIRHVETLEHTETVTLRRQEVVVDAAADGDLHRPDPRPDDGQS